MNKPKILIASFPSVFFEDLNELLGNDFEIIGTGSSEKAYQNKEDINYISYQEAISPLKRKVYKFIGKVLIKIEKLIYQIEIRDKAKLNELKKKPTISAAIVNSYMVRAVSKKINPDIVIGLNLFSFGLAACNSKSISFCYIYGSDYFTYPKQSVIRYKYHKYVLKSIDNILSGSKDLCEQIQKKYNTRYIVFPLSFSKSMQSKLDLYDKSNVRENRMTKSSVKRIFFCRKFLKSHGSEIIQEAVIQLAQKYERIEIIILSGKKNNEDLDNLEKQIMDLNLSSKFRIYKGFVSLDDYIKLAYESDLFISMMQFADMKSQSNRICAYCRSIPVLREWPAYREMKDGGFKYITIEENTVDGLLNAIEVGLKSNPKEFDSNRIYLAGNNEKNLKEFRSFFFQVLN